VERSATERSGSRKISIGIDPVTLEEVVLGDFLLDSIDPLTAFEYAVLDPATLLLSMSFTTGERYRFSTGLEIQDEVTKSL
jgi:hypothetical protein